MLKICLPCPNCNLDAECLVNEASTEGLRCNFCLAEIERVRVEKVEGFVYMLTNEAMPGLLKIGYTNRPIDERMRELSASTSVPLPFELVAFYAVLDAKQTEEKIHLILSDFRKSGKEFFELPLADAIALIKDSLQIRPQFSSINLIGLYRQSPSDIKAKCENCQTINYVPEEQSAKPSDPICCSCGQKIWDWDIPF